MHPCRAPCVHQASARNGHRRSGTVAKGQRRDDPSNGVSTVHRRKFAGDSEWSGAGSNRRPSAFQVNRAKRCTDLQKRTPPTSRTALGGRCVIHASRQQLPRTTATVVSVIVAATQLMRGDGVRHARRRRFTITASPAPYRAGAREGAALLGWLSTELPLYQPSTLSLKTHVHTQPVGHRPLHRTGAYRSPASSGTALRHHAGARRRSPRRCCTPYPPRCRRRSPSAGSSGCRVTVSTC